MTKIKSGPWHAWVNKQPIQPTPAGTLHVTGEIVTHPSKAAVLVRKIPQGINPRILLLEIITHPSGVPTKQPQQLHYAEVLVKEKQYTSIDIFYEGKKLASIKKIPIVI